MKIFIIILSLLVTTQVNADARVLFNGSIQVQNSTYLSSNLTVNFKNVNTGQSCKVLTALNSGNYSVQVFRGLYEVSVTDIRTVVLFKGFISVPTSSGVIIVNPFCKILGQLYISGYPKNFSDHTLTIKSESTLEVQEHTDKIDNSGKFSISLKKGKYELNIKKEGVVIVSKIILVDKNQRVDFDLSAPTQEEEEEEEEEEEKEVIDDIVSNQRTKISLATTNFNFLIPVIILVSSLCSVYFTQYLRKAMNN